MIKLKNLLNRKELPKDRYFLLLRHGDGVGSIPFFYTGGIVQKPQRYNMFDSWLGAWRQSKHFSETQIKKIIELHREDFRKEGMDSYGMAAYTSLFYIDDAGEERPVTDQPDYDLRNNFIYFNL